MRYPRWWPREAAAGFSLSSTVGYDYEGMSMAHLWHNQNKPQQARDLPASVYGWFTEGFDMLDLKEAKALLGELAS
jgi:hypothetical protein